MRSDEWKTFMQVSRIAFGRTYGDLNSLTYTDDIQIGALQRIALALEAIAAGPTVVQMRLELEEVRKQLREARRELKKAGLRKPSGKVGKSW
jgi:hypothetical protein